MMSYSTIQGDVYDLISYKVYGDEGFLNEIAAANPAHMETVMFNSGVVLVIPDKPETPPPSRATTPPWRL